MGNTFGYKVENNYHGKVSGPYGSNMPNYGAGYYAKGGYGTSNPFYGNPQSHLGHAQSMLYQKQPTFVTDLEPASISKPKRPLSNVLWFAASILLPWILFASLLGLYSSRVHYHQPQWCYILLAVSLTFVVWAFGVEWGKWLYKRHFYGDYTTNLSWYGFLFFSSLLGIILGAALGNANFDENFKPYWDMRGMQAYHSVDPSQFTGSQLMDAGIIGFTEGSKVDASKMMAFRNWDTYCVAPITDNKGNTSYDFWAVGMNCCDMSSHTRVGKQFHCGMANAHKGIRILDENARSFYRLAVMQAEASFNIQSHHPVFLHWMEEPEIEVQSYQRDGVAFIVRCVLAYFAINLFVSICALVQFTYGGILQAW